MSSRPPPRSTPGELHGETWPQGGDRKGSGSGETGGEEGNGGFRDWKYPSKPSQPLAAAVDCSLKTSLSF